jgi:hypothetical protein
MRNVLKTSFRLVVIILSCLPLVACEEVETPTKSSTQPTTRPTTQPTVQPATAPASQPAPPPVAEPTPPPPRPAPRPSKPDKLTSEEMELVPALQKKNFDLIMDLRKAEEQNLRLRRALLEARDSTGKLQSRLNRSAVFIEIQKYEIRELEEQMERLGRDTHTPRTAPAAGSKEPVKTPAETMLELSRLKRKNEKLRLQLKLAAMKSPEKTKKILVEHDKAGRKIEELEKTHKKLARLTVTQAETIKTLKNRRQLWVKEIAAAHDATSKARQAQAAAESEVRTARQEAKRARQAAEQAKFVATAARKEVQLVREEALAAAKQRQLSAGDKEKLLTEMKRQLAEAQRARDEALAAVKQRQLSAGEKEKLLAEMKIQLAEAHRKLQAAVKQASKPHLAVKPPIKQPIAAKPKPKPKPTAAQPVVTQKRILGKITAIRQMMLLIDVGSKDGLEKGMRLIVFRGDRFVGYLRVDEVAETESAGTLVRTVMNPQVGDNVIDRLD